MADNVLGRVGNLETRLARSDSEIKAAQRLRYEVFYREMNASPSVEAQQTGLDQDRFDGFCDHLLVVENSDDGSERIVATYRLMLESHMQAAGCYYTDGEYDLQPLRQANHGKQFLELGRSCVLADYRSKRTMELLWHGTWAYAVQNSIDIMFGCASFQGTDPADFADTLGWLIENVQLSREEDCPAVVPNSIDLTSLNAAGADPRRALAKLPPLLKGYMRLGAKIASHAVVDHQFGTTDVLVVLKVADINPRYLAHFGVDASRFVA